MSTSRPADGHAPALYDEIERVPALDPKEFRDRYVRQGLPVVLRGGADLAGWTGDRCRKAFRDELADLEVTALKTEKGRLLESGSPFGRVRLGDFFGALEKDTSPGWHVSAPIAEFPSDFASRFAPPGYIRDSPFIRSRLWIAPTGTVTPLHWDLPANFIASFFGRRKVILLNPLYSFALYPHTPFARMPNFASYDPEQQNLDRFPLARFARPVGTIIGPGDLLFVPPRWWHHIRTLESSMVVNYWFGGLATRLAWQAGSVFKSFKGIYKGEWRAES